MKKKCLNSRSLFFGVSIFVILSLVIMFAISYDFTNSIYVITKDETTDVTYYYEINDKGKRRKTKQFEPEKMEEYTVDHCYESYIGNNKVLNRLTLDTCVIKDSRGDSVEITEELRNIITKVSELEHDIIKNKILNLNNECYVVVEFNVNLWSPYSLYYYDKNNQKLKRLYTFDGEDIIGLKLQ